MERDVQKSKNLNSTLLRTSGSSKLNPGFEKAGLSVFLRALALFGSKVSSESASSLGSSKDKEAPARGVSRALRRPTLFFGFPNETSESSALMWRKRKWCPNWLRRGVNFARPTWSKSVAPLLCSESNASIVTPNTLFEYLQSGQLPFKPDLALL